MYDSKKMPKGLVDIHDKIDNYVDTIYNKGGFNSDQVRLKCLLSYMKN